MVQGLKRKRRSVKMWVTPEFKQHMYKLKADKHPDKSLLDIMDEEIVKKKRKVKRHEIYWGKI
jgi:uncharacterized protein YktB (UPF0637 family)